MADNQTIEKGRVAYNRLKHNTIESLMKSNSDIDAPYFSAKMPNAVVWTRRSLAEGIKNDNEEALDVLNGLISLAADLVSREKEKL